MSYKPGNGANTSIFLQGFNSNQPGTVASLLESVAFSSAIKFDKLVTRYAQQVVSGPVAFTIQSNPTPILGGAAIVRLVANAVDIPTFAGFKIFNGSSGYDNRSGILNVIQMFFDGTDYWVSIFQEDNAQIVDTTPPTVASAVIPATAANTVVITFSENLQTALPSASAFTLTGKTVNTVAISGATVTLTVNAAFVASDTTTLSYTAPSTNPLRDTAGNQVANITNRAVTNNVGSSGSTVTVTFPTRTANITVSGNVYTSTGAGYNETMLAAQSLPVNTDGWYLVDMGAGATANGFIGFNTTNANEAWQQYEYGAFYSAGNVWRASSGNIGSTGVAALRYLRLRRAGTSVVIETSADKSTWNSAFTFTGVPVNQIYYLAAALQGTLTMRDFEAQGVV